MRSSLGQVVTVFQVTDDRCSLRIRDNTNCAQGRVREATLRHSHHISPVFSYKRDSGPICGAQTQTKKDLVQVNTIVSSCENVFGNPTVYVICTKDIICLLPWLAFLSFKQNITNQNFILRFYAKWLCLLPMQEEAAFAGFSKIRASVDG